MATESPVLLLGYNRPNQMRGLIQSLAPLKLKLILFAVDGPKCHRSNDADLVRQTQDLVDEITGMQKFAPGLEIQTLVCEGQLSML